MRIVLNRFISGFRQDARYALRGIRRSLAFTIFALASLTIGIGANAAMFSFVHAVLVKQLPVVEAHRLVTFNRTSGATSSPVAWSLTTIEEVSERLPSLSGAFGWFTRPINWSTGDGAQWVNGELVTGQYFRTLQVRAAVGRLLNEDDVRDAAGTPVCVLSYSFWQRFFGGDPNVVGRTVFLNGHPYGVIGVTEQSFQGAELQRRFDIVIPATRIGDFMPTFSGPSGMERLRSMSWLAPMARLAPGISRGEAERQVQLLMEDIDPRPQAEVRLVDGSQGFNPMRRGFGRPVLILMGLVTLMLLVTCANVANLLLTRAQVRAREFAVRLSLGASRARLIRLLLLEVVMLGITGVVAGVALSFWITSTVVAFLNSGQAATSALHVIPDMQVLFVSALLSFAKVFVFGLVPAWRASRPDLVEHLKDGSSGSSLRSRMLLRRGLVVSQVTLSFVIVFGAALLARTLQELAAIDLGYDPERVIALNVDPAAAGYSGAEATRVLNEIATRARELPGVRAASLASSTPGGYVFTANVEVPGYIPGPLPGDAAVSQKFVSPQYFQTMGQALLRGRDFDGRDTHGSARVAIVSQAFVDHYLNGRDPIGAEFQQGEASMAIVGVVADAREYSIRSAPGETVYLPYTQAPPAQLTLLVRAENDPRRIIPSLTGIVRTIDRRMPVFSLHTLDRELAAGLSAERILGYLSTLFGAFAILVAAIGLHGVVRYSISRRAREIGIRLALGAQKRDLVKLFGRESLTLVLAGLSLGVPLALASARMLRGLIFGVAAHDPLTLTGSAVVVLAVCVLATFPLLWRASRTDPAIALRQE